MDNRLRVFTFGAARQGLSTVGLMLALAGVLTAGEPARTQAKRGPLDPRGQLHLPIGIPNTLDVLKTFVEAEGNFSPGVGSYGIYFWVYDPQAKRLVAPTMDGVACEHGLSGPGFLIPWSEWHAGEIVVTTEVCEVEKDTHAGRAFVVGARAKLANEAKESRQVALYVALRPLGPAGWDVKRLDVAESSDALLVDGHPALVANEKPSAVGVLAEDKIGALALEGKMPGTRSAASPSGDCSGALRFDLTIPAGGAKTIGLVCPVLAGRRAVRHQWDGVSEWAQFDLAKPNPAEGGVLQPDPGLKFFQGIHADTLFDEARKFWEDFGITWDVELFELPDKRWAEALTAIQGHAAMAMNEGAPDVAVVNYNVYSRDGVYVASILQKSGQCYLAAEAIDYFLRYPFNGRSYPEADNPGQILWIMGEQRRFTWGNDWLKAVYPKAKKLAGLIAYYRTAPGPHWVAMDSLDFGDALPKEKRRELKPGRCDGFHPEYTEAFDIAGLRAAAMLARAMKQDADAAAWDALAAKLFEAYRKKFETKLPANYGSYCVLWPCRLYPFHEGEALRQFKNTGAQKPSGWRYFPLATAHQGLLAGNREAAWRTIQMHLDHPQMRGWYLFDEGGKSGAGGWQHLRTTWDSSVAMPHGWAIAELWLLMRDALLYETEDRLTVLAGVPPEWLTGTQRISFDLPTHFGPCQIIYEPTSDGAEMYVRTCSPVKEIVFPLPLSIPATCTSNGKPIPRNADGSFTLPGWREIRFQWSKPPVRQAGG